MGAGTRAAFMFDGQALYQMGSLSIVLESSFLPLLYDLNNEDKIIEENHFYMVKRFTVFTEVKMF